MRSPSPPFFFVLTGHLFFPPRALFMRALTILAMFPPSSLSPVELRGFRPPLDPLPSLFNEERFFSFSFPPCGFSFFVCRLIFAAPKHKLPSFPAFPSTPEGPTCTPHAFFFVEGKTNPGPKAPFFPACLFPGPGNFCPPPRLLSSCDPPPLFCSPASWVPLTP